MYYIESSKKRKSNQSKSFKSKKTNDQESRYAVDKKSKDPTLSDEYEKLTKWYEKNEFIEKKIKEKKIFAICWWTHQDYLRTKIRNSSKFKNTNSYLSYGSVDKAWWFGYKAMFIFKQDPQGNVIKYERCSARGIKCKHCAVWMSDHSRGTLVDRVKAPHQGDISLEPQAVKQLFCDITGIDINEISNDQESIELDNKLKSLMDEYVNDPQNVSLAAVFEGKLKPPIHASTLGGPAAHHLTRSIVEMLVALGCTPNAAQKRPVYKLIEICICILS